MPIRGVSCIRGFVEMDEHRRCQREEVGPPCSISPTILEMMVRPNMERMREGVKFSPSSLSTCHRQTVLSGQHDWYLPVEQGYKMIRGTIVHQGLENEPPIPGVLGVVTELRMNAPLDTNYGMQTFHGKADLITLNSIEHVLPEKQAVDDKGNLLTMQGRTVLHVKITDYKTRTEVGHDLVAADSKHVYQVNMYAWLIEQYLPGWINTCLGYGQDLDGEDIAGAGNMVYDDGGCGKHMRLTVPNLPHIDEVVVDELSIQYMDMKKPRTFTSRGFLYAQGKMLGERGNDGRWHRFVPPVYEELELEPIHQFQSSYTEAIIRKGIEDQIESEETLAPPLAGDDARIMCGNCPVLQICYTTGKREGYSMEGQVAYATANKQAEW